MPDVCQKVPAPCFKDVECYNIEKPPYYKCGVCPEGLTGNGTWCNDLDECDLADPCDVAATCYNLIPGFRFTSSLFKLKHLFSSGAAPAPRAILEAMGSQGLVSTMPPDNARSSLNQKMSS